VDVEGSYMPVFEGASEILTITRALHFEVSKLQCSWFGYRLLELLNSKGFLLFSVRSNGSLEQIDTDYETERVENLIGLKDPEGFQARTGWLIQRK
jgi:hypothetical protein